MSGPGSTETPNTAWNRPGQLSACSVPAGTKARLPASSRCRSPLPRLVELEHAADEVDVDVVGVDVRGAGQLGRGQVGFGQVEAAVANLRDRLVASGEMMLGD
jgi:hypothetical protein